MPSNWAGNRALTWLNGIDLTSIGNTTFTYDGEGQRVSKTTGSTTTTYTYEGDQLVMQTTGNTSLFFLYDANGLIGFDHIVSGTTTAKYYYQIDGKGEIVGITDTAGNVVAKYTYDAWGNPISITNANGNAITDSNNIGIINPFRYKSYYYDTDTGLYYLNSRYYDPRVCRFISTDKIDNIGMDGSPISYNLFTYSVNNPVNMFDKNGTWPSWATKLAIGVGAIIVGATVAAITAATGGAATAFVGALTTGIKAAVVSGAISAAISVGTSINKHKKSTGNREGAEEVYINNAINGFATGFMAGGVMSGASQVLSSCFNAAASAGVPTGRNGGINISDKVKILSPNHLHAHEKGGTLIKIGSKYKNIRFDVGSKSLTHMNIQLAKKENYHFPLGIVAAGLWGGRNND